MFFMVAVVPADEFVFNNGVEPESLDPHRLSAQRDALLSLQMFEGLVGKDANYEKLVPALAELPEISKDGLRYSFKIRRGFKWSNGEEITIDQIRESFLRAMRPDVSSPFLSFYTDNIEGALEYSKNYAASDRKVFEERVGIKIKPSHILEIKLLAPCVQFKDYLALPAFAVVHPSMYAADARWSDPKNFIVNGPYGLKSWEVNKKIILQKNPFFREAAHVKIPTVVALALNDQSATLNLYRTKQIDWTGENTFSSSMVPSLRSDPEFKMDNAYGTYTIIFNTEHKPFKDVRVRKALSLAIHRAEITDKIMRGGQIPTYRLVPEGIRNYKPDLVARPPFDKQIEMARELLAEAGYPGGKGFPKVTYVYNTDESHHRIAQAIQQMWKKNLGIEIQLQSMEWKVFLKAQEARQFDISRQTWVGDIPDPISILEIFGSKSSLNYTGWGNRRFDQLLGQAGGIKDQKKRHGILAQAENLVLDEMPFIPIYHYVWFSMLRPNVEGYKPNIMGRYQFKYFSKR